ncbi:HlyD family secretion protein [Dysgonomonas sp. PH5-45]|uniref:efflux RND transporter periplasmic adaptor subunit n=1 Tax=unclassified Dysgonomonas TaxID=2630389 RepID=UPI0024731EF4|nr:MULTISPECIES: efflux RND transporter periplasmic adaptor subunit [unclassified Dysgonomonas]MDH6354448.1 HlyD family secretion protein [Dysgonomonas sp. PH5-45]MDH6387347.1 HlyD family secretion protein [Dysgonomonas sp. PH5-37]
MNKKNKKYLIILVAIVVVLGAAFFFWPSHQKNEMALDVAAVQNGDISMSVTATGTVEPITLVEVGTQVSGVISKIYVDYNSVVKAGQVLAELDTRLLTSELETANANLSSKEVEYQNQLKNYNRQKELWEKQAISKADWENAEMTYKTAKLAVTSSQAAVLKARTNLGYATITSTIDGVVISRAVEEGQTVAASFSTPTLFTIANDLTKMRVIANVDEADIGNVAEGQRVSFTVDAYPNDEFAGTVVQVRLEATTTSNVVTYEVVIDAPNPDLKLKPGLTANVNIYTLEKNNVLKIPTKAFRFTPSQDILKQIPGIIIGQAVQVDGRDKSKKVVWVKAGNKLVSKIVTVGVADEIYTEILDGLQKDEQVVTGLGQKMEMVPAPSEQAETSPFMPQRPGGNKKK